MAERIVDEEMSQAWLEAAKDLGIRVTAPFCVPTAAGRSVAYEFYLPDFGGPKGIVVGSFGSFRNLDDDLMLDRLLDESYVQEHGYPAHLCGLYSQYDRETFIVRLNDFGWYGDESLCPAWYTGKSMVGRTEEDMTEAERLWLLRQQATDKGADNRGGG